MKFGNSSRTVNIGPIVEKKPQRCSPSPNYHSGQVFLPYIAATGSVRKIAAAKVTVETSPKFQRLTMAYFDRCWPSLAVPTDRVKVTVVLPAIRILREHGYHRVKPQIAI